jgi:hypothetical protein
MRRTPLLGVATSLCLIVGASACSSDSGGGDSTRDDMVDDLSQTLEDGGLGLDGEQADCAAGVIVDEIGVDTLKDVDLTADTPPEELREEITAAQSAASEECDLPSVSGG